MIDYSIPALLLNNTFDGQIVTARRLYLTLLLQKTFVNQVHNWWCRNEQTIIAIAAVS